MMLLHLLCILYRTKRTNIDTYVCVCPYDHVYYIEQKRIDIDSYFCVCYYDYAYYTKQKRTDI